MQGFLVACRGDERVLECGNLLVSLKKIVGDELVGKEKLQLSRTVMTPSNVLSEG